MMQCEIRLIFLIHTPNIFKSPKKYRHSTIFYFGLQIQSGFSGLCSLCSFISFHQLKFVLRLRGFVWECCTCCTMSALGRREGRVGDWKECLELRSEGWGGAMRCAMCTMNYQKTTWQDWRSVVEASVKKMWL